MSTHDPRVVIRIVAAVVVIGYVWVAFRHAGSHREIGLRALRSGLEGDYDGAASESPPSETGQASIFAEVFRWVLNNKNDILPSFGNPKNVLLSGGLVRISSDHWVCVVRMRDGGLYGIGGRRIGRAVAPSELGTWSHTGIIMNPPTMR